MLIGAAALLAIGAVVFGPAIAHAGFYADDWENGASAAYSYDPLRIIYHEPILGWLLPLPHLLFGAHPAWHLALALVLGVGTSLTFAALLVRLRMLRRDAFVISALALICPFADSLRLWSTAGLNSVALILCFAGVSGGIDRLRGRRDFLAQRYRWLLGASLLTYAAVLPVCLLTGLVYRLAGVPWERAQAAWRGDAWRLLPVVVFVAIDSPKQRLGVRATLAHTARIGRDAISLLGHALIPIDGIAYSTSVLVAAALAAGLTVGLRRRAGRGVGMGATAERALRWLSVAGVALIAVAASWISYLSAPPFYHPLATGILNRVNLLAAFPTAVLVYALAAFVVSPLPRAWRALPVALIAVGWTVWVRRDVHHYILAAHAQAAVLDQVRALPSRPGPLSVFVGGYRFTAAQDVPVFVGSWDLDGAVKLARHDGDAVGEPLRATAMLVCGRVAAVPDDAGVNRLVPRPYTGLVLLNVALHRWIRVSNQRQCVSRAAWVGFRARAGVPLARDNLGRPTSHASL